MFHRHSPTYARLIVILLLTLCISGAKAQIWTKDLAAGVIFTQKISNGSSPLIINMIKADLKAPGISIKAVSAQDNILGMETDKLRGRETVSSIARRLNAVAAINADFFPFTGDMLSLHVSCGEIMSEPWPGRVVFGITSDGQCLIGKPGFDAKVILPDGRPIDIRGVNRSPGKNEVVVYTPKFSKSTLTNSSGTEAVIRCNPWPVKVGTQILGTVVEIRAQKGNTSIPEDCIVLSGSGMCARNIENWLIPGATVTLGFKLNPPEWGNVIEAVGGGPWLVKDGRIHVDAAEQGFKPDVSAGANPRTAIGITSDGKIVMSTVDGRQSISKGVSLAQLAEIMLAEGCKEAINLDGGGSTTMATSSGILNSPSGGSERPVANALAIMGDLPKLECPDFIISRQAPADTDISADATQASIYKASMQSESQSIESGQVGQFTLVDLSTNKSLEPELAKKAIWSITGGIGLIDQSGKFYAIRAGKGKITARIGAKSIEIPVTVAAGKPYKLTAKFIDEPACATNRSVLEVLVVDVNGNPVPDRKISITVTAGTPDQAEAVTDRNGKASIGITWETDTAKTGSAEVSCSDLKPVIMDR